MKSFFLSLFILINIYITGTAQISFGVMSGLQLAGEQDQKFKRFDKSGKLERKILPNEVESNVSTFNSFYVTYSISNRYSLRLTRSIWEFNSYIESDELPEHIPISTTVQQDRETWFMTFVCKYPLSIGENNKSLIYIGVGGGLVLSDIDPGGFERNIGLNFIGGYNMNLTNRLLLSVELRYILTHDVDNFKGVQDGWAVDTSGSPAPLRLGPHLDTRFGAVQLGFGYMLSRIRI